MKCYFCHQNLPLEDNVRQNCAKCHLIYYLAPQIGVRIIEIHKKIDDVKYMIELNLIDKDTSLFVLSKKTLHYKLISKINHIASLTNLEDNLKILNLKAFL